MNSLSEIHPLTINDRALEVHLTPAAKTALAARHAPLYAQMELYFSCLLRLKVRFYEQAPLQDVDWQVVNKQLQVSFRPVMTASCGNDFDEREPPVTDFPIVRDAPFTPRWLKLDYRQGQWLGEFGYQQRD